MNFKEFDNNFRLIGYYQHGKNEVIKELLLIDDLDQLFNSFAKELNYNLLEKDSKESKENIIRYYLTQLQQIAYFFKEKEDITKYKEKAHTVYKVLFDEIQLVCNSNQIDFFKLCDEVKLDTSTFDSTISLFYSEAEESNSIDSENRTKALIKDAFENMDKKGWEYAFKSNTDYNTFVDILTLFFEYKEYSLPKEPIELKRGTKTKLGRILGELHKELSENPLKSDANYLKLVRSLSHYTNETDLYKVLTR